MYSLYKGSKNQLYSSVKWKNSGDWKSLKKLWGTYN